MTDKDDDIQAVVEEFNRRIAFVESKYTERIAMLERKIHELSQEPQDERYVTVERAAELTLRQPQTIRRWMREKYISWELQNGRRMILLNSLRQHLLGRFPDAPLPIGLRDPVQGYPTDPRCSGTLDRE